HSRRPGRIVPGSRRQFLLQAFTQVFRMPEQPFTGAGFQEQCVPVAGNAYLAAVLVTPGSQAFQSLLRGSLIARICVGGLPLRVSVVQAPGMEIQD
ncbi:hypothetical protein ACFL1C_03230, partial [Pseudomonadota bacterium]